MTSSVPENARGDRVWRWVGVTVALILLNLSLTFTNVWPTLSVRSTSEVSLELAACVLGLVVVRWWFGAPSRVMLRWLSVVWVLLVVGRYVDATTRSLYGRDVNLYWDMRHVPNVGAMFSFVAEPWLRAAVVAGIVGVPLVGYVVARWALGQIGRATGEPAARRVLGGAAAGVLLLGVAQSLGARTPEAVRFSDAVTPAVAREVKELAYEMTGAGVRALGPPPALSSDFSRVEGADVILIFLESYGAVSWDRAEFVEGLAQSRSRLEGTVRDTDRGVMSAFVESTTFGGESWLSHISLLSGTEVRDQGTNVRLMAQQRDTLVKAFGRHGYRTVAVMPGLLQQWPEGAFYGFEDIYDHERLDYHGPPFGWWDLSDQFALARVDSLEVAPLPRRPAFVFFPTITTHAPFTPAPPYQPDWERVLTANPYDADELDRAWSDYPDWLNLGPSYVKGLNYAYATLDGYLQLRADRDLVLIVIGDHQPPSLVSGEGASWDVPIHVIANRRAILERLGRHRFHQGLLPQHPSVARMDELLPILLDAFGDTDDADRGPDCSPTCERE